MHTIITSVVGVTFANQKYGVNRQEIIKRLSGKEKVYLKREPKNRFDSNAVAVMVVRKDGDLKVGFIKAELAGILSEFWSYYKFNSTIKEIRIGGGQKKWGISLEIRKFRKNKKKVSKKRR